MDVCGVFIHCSWHTGDCNDYKLLSLATWTHRNGMTQTACCRHSLLSPTLQCELQSEACIARVTRVSVEGPVLYKSGHRAKGRQSAANTTMASLRTGALLLGTGHLTK